MKIIKINTFTIYLFFICLLCGYIKIAIIIFLIVLFHEAGHILFIKWFGYEIIDVTIYPFGGITRIKKDLNGPIKEDLFIAFGGVLFQIILYLVLLLPIDTITKEIFLKYNTTILLFNLIPIIPLDGSKIINAILNNFLSFRKSLIIYNAISFTFIVIYTIFNYWYGINNYFITCLFIYKTIESVKNTNFLYNKFLLERYLNNYKFKHIKTNIGNISILKKDTYQYFKEIDRVVSERKKLQERFDKKRHF